MAIALVTGTSTGIGYTTALHLARNGYKTYATMRNLAKAGPLREAAAAEGLAVEVIELDVDDDASMTTGVGRMLAREDRIDVLVNNAGIGYGMPLEYADMKDLRAVMETNYFGAARMMQLVIPGMRERRSGTIVNISSISGIFAAPVQGPYCASKFALEALAESVAAEVAPFGVRVANVEPGVVLTPIFEKSEPAPLPPGFPYAAPVERLWKIFEQCLANPAMPQDVADVVLHAITTDKPRLRYLVGRDAEHLAAWQARSGAEGKLAVLGEADDAVFWRRAREELPYLNG